jgi:hypothetical protein
METNPVAFLQAQQARPSTEVLLSTLLAGMAELAPVGPARRVFSLFAPVVGYSLAWLLRYCIRSYEHAHFYRQVDKLVAQLRQEAAANTTSQARKKVIDAQVNELTLLKQKALLFPVHLQEKDI